MNMTIEQITAAYPNVAKLESQAGRELLAAAVGKMNALAVENAGLMNVDNWMSRDDIGYVAQAIAEGNGEDAAESLRAGLRAIIDDIPTPATDAFQAEVRAQGVESYAEQLKSEADRAEETGWEDAAKFLRSESEKVQEFAAQLRQGESK
ncbi:hypothetical protein ACG0Z5_10885 [Scandinavium sp. M-37]|uniref:hypothetical protein n=1 Tax=Scandinavium sp. M-37 TaxID=3373077 RepID=UPI003746ABDA